MPNYGRHITRAQVQRALDRAREMYGQAIGQENWRSIDKYGAQITVLEALLDGDYK